MSSGDTSANLVTYWKTKLDDVIAGNMDPPGPGEELQVKRQSVLNEQLVTVKSSMRKLGRGPGTGVPEAITTQFHAVKDAFGRRKEAERPAEPGARGNVKHAHPFDNSKLLKMEADMAKKFADKVAAPGKDIRDSRVVEQRKAHVTEFCRGCELFDKCDYEACLPEFTRAIAVDALRLYAMLNRGNAYKALGMAAEAIACYQDVLDESGLDAASTRIIHSYALNNLGAASQDDGRLEQAQQHLGDAVALNPKCYLAIRNRANLHLHVREGLAAAEQPSLLPPQDELALGYYAKAMEVDWHLPVAFAAGPAPVIMRAEARITSKREEPSEQIRRNHVYHFTSNLCARMPRLLLLLMLLQRVPTLQDTTLTDRLHV